MSELRKQIDEVLVNYGCGGLPRDTATDTVMFLIENEIEEKFVLRAAVQRQVTNIERWLETGEPADEAESQSIYNQLVNALGDAS